jgi:hypothetical protein
MLEGFMAERIEMEDVAAKSVFPKSVDRCCGC